MGMRRHPLTPVAIATAGILSGLAVTLGVLASAMPLFTLFFRVGSAVPLAMLAARLRPRVCLLAAGATVFMALGVAGVSTAWTVAQSAVVGLIVGALHRTSAPRWAVGAAAASIGAVGGFAALALLWLLDDLRSLFLESVRASIDGYLTLLGSWDALEPAAREISSGLGWMVDHWWAWAPPLAALGLVTLTLVSYWLMGAVLARLTLADIDDPLAPSPEPAGRVAPLPIRLDDVSFTYPDSPSPALDSVSLEIEPGSFIVVAGPNGSGKSTLALLLAGAAPSSGRVDRPGDAGLGSFAGTALVAQRSDVLVLGDTLEEDVLWGVGDQERNRVDVEGVLALVGLDGLAQASTRHLSGGQLQRLALAGALVRKPSLLISDESTAMIDQRGREDMLRILRSLPSQGTTVVHITHDPVEARAADRLIRLDAGRIVSDETPQSPSEHEEPRTDAPHLAAPAFLRGGAEHLWASRVGHAYDFKTPWQAEVLTDIDLIVSAGQATLITGANGSGKTTLSRILAGLVRPTWGRCTLGSSPVWMRVGDVALSRQFARLGLQRPTVGLDILSAAGYGPSVGASRAQRRGLPRLTPDAADDLVATALREVGLDPALSRSNIDELSGGQMRRVALAGLLAADPSILILDEPMAGLDAESRARLVDVLDHRRAVGLGIVIISHDDAGLESLCDSRRTLVKGVLS